MPGSDRRRRTSRRVLLEPSLSLEECSRLQDTAGQYPDLRRQRADFGEPQLTRTFRAEYRGEHCIGKAEALGSTVCPLHGLWGAGPLGGLPTSGKSPWKGKAGQRSLRAHVARNRCCPHQPQSTESSESSCLSSGFSRLKTVLSSLTKLDDPKRSDYFQIACLHSRIKLTHISRNENLQHIVKLTISGIQEKLP